MKRIVLAALLSVGAAGCSTQEPSSESASGTKGLAQTQVDAATLSISLPVGVFPNEVGLAATEGLTIHDGQISAGSVSHARILQASSNRVEIGADAVLGSAETPVRLDFGGNLFLRERAAIHGNVSLGGQLETQNQWTIDGDLASGAAYPETTELTWELEPVSGGRNPLHLEPDQTVTLSPGAHGHVTVKSRATLKLSPGTYEMDSLEIHSDGILELTGAGPVIVRTRGQVSYRGEVTGTAASSRFLLASAAATNILIDAPFRGTILAPEAAVTLSPVDGSGHQGAFFAKNLSLHARNGLEFQSFSGWEAIFPELFQVTESAVGIPQRILDALPPDVTDGVRSLSDTTPPGPGIIKTSGFSTTNGDVRTKGQFGTLNDPFVVEITSHTEGNDAIGGAETYLVATVNGEELPRDDSLDDCGTSAGGPCPTILVSVPSFQDEVQVMLAVRESDDIAQDDDELTVTLEVDNLTGSTTGAFVSDENREVTLLADGEQCATSPDGFGLCWKIIPSGRAKFCPTFKAAYIDVEGPLATDPFGNPETAEVPASLAHLSSFVVMQGSKVTFDWDGVLDENGCIPASQMPPLEVFAGQEQTGEPLTVTTRLETEFTIDGSTITVSQQGSGSGNGPAEICTVWTEDPSAVIPSGCASFVEAPGDRFPHLNGRNLQFRAEATTSTTRGAGVVAKMLRREVLSGNQLSISQAMDGKPRYVLDVGGECTISSGQSSAFAREDYLCLEDQRNTPAPDDTFLQYVVAHEFAHSIQARMGAAPKRTSFYWFDGSQRWGCDHYAEDQGFGTRLHCLQGHELAGEAQIEGYAQFFAALALSPASGGCQMNYYKPVLWPECLPGTPECEAAGDNFISKPPMKIDCDRTWAHRNDDPNMVPGPAPFPYVHAPRETLGTELDWMAFYRELEREGILSNPAILEVYQQANLGCGTPTCDTSFDGTEVELDGGPVKSLLAAIEAVGGLAASTEAAEAGDDHTVSTVLP